MLNGKTAIVTGSTSGIGLGIAQGLAARGANVVLSGFGDADEIETTRAGLAAETGVGVGVGYSGADMSDPAAIRDMVAEAKERFGAVDILVNNAGIQHVAPVEEFPDAKWDAILAINLSSAFHAAKAVLSGMRAQGWGRIVNIASAHGLVASPFKSAYVAAKHGMIGLTRTIALETAEAGVTVNAICPGYVRTPLVEAQIAGQAQAHGISEEEVVRDVLLASQPNKAFVETGQLAALVAFLCSDDAATLTGAALPVDGAWTAQ